MERLPPLKSLRAFEAAARFESFNRAAQALNVTPSAVSHQIKVLEDAVGVQLFERLTRQVVLSPQGRDYLPAIRDAFTQIRVATEKLRPREEVNAITVSSAPSFAVGWLMPRLPQFQLAYPDTEVRLISSIELEDFTRPDLDIAIRTGRGHWQGLRSHRLMAEALVPLCSPELARAGNGLHCPKDLANTNLIHELARLGQWRSWLAAAGVEGVDAERGPKFQGASMAAEAAIAGLGVALANRRMVEAHLKAGRLVIPFDIQLPGDNAFYLVYPEERAGNEKIDAFTTWLLESIEKESTRPLIE